MHLIKVKRTKALPDNSLRRTFHRSCYSPHPLRSSLHYTAPPAPPLPSTSSSPWTFCHPVQTRVNQYIRMYSLHSFTISHTHKRSTRIVQSLGLLNTKSPLQWNPDHPYHHHFGLVCPICSTPLIFFDFVMWKGIHFSLDFPVEPLLPIQLLLQQLLLLIPIFFLFLLRLAYLIITLLMYRLQLLWWNGLTKPWNILLYRWW